MPMAATVPSPKPSARAPLFDSACAGDAIEAAIVTAATAAMIDFLNIWNSPGLMVQICVLLQTLWFQSISVCHGHTYTAGELNHF